MLRCAIILLAAFTTLASSKAINHEVLQCTTKAFTSPWSETFNNFLGLTPKYTPGTFIAVDCTQIPNMRCDAIPENVKWYVGRLVVFNACTHAVDPVLPVRGSIACVARKLLQGISLGL
ncbi:hypothetical protein V8E53_013425 [Lactarius tabidus]